MVSNGDVSPCVHQYSHHYGAVKEVLLCILQDQLLLYDECDLVSSFFFNASVVFVVVKLTSNSSDHFSNEEYADIVTLMHKQQLGNIIGNFSNVESPIKTFSAMCTGILEKLVNPPSWGMKDHCDTKSVCRTTCLKCLSAIQLLACEGYLTELMVAGCKCGELNNVGLYVFHVQTVQAPQLITLHM
jgi:hypothetical protein